MNEPADRSAHWQLPTGVSRGVWDYTRSDSIAGDYDNYFDDHPLFQMDLSIVDDFYPTQLNRPVIGDFGCGTGRVLTPLAERGCVGLAIDLSQRMLDVVQTKSEQQDLDIHCLRANLVDLSCIADASIDMGICMFSTLGMIRGSENRAKALQHIHRVLKPDAPFILHVHNHWFHLFDPGGVRWVIADLFMNLFRRNQQFGDKYCDYRGVPRVYLHSFRKRELRNVLSKAGFAITRWQPLSATQAQPLPFPKWLEGIRASGWLVALSKSNLD